MIKFAIGVTVVGEPIVLTEPTPEEREQLASAGMAWGMGIGFALMILLGLAAAIVMLP